MAAEAAFSRFVLDCLRAMDTEAVPLPDGTPTGLCWYQGHLGSLGKKVTGRHEESWFPRLAQFFVDNGHAASRECAYPGAKALRSGARRCDLQIAWPGLGRTWLEIKGAWRFTDAVGLVPNRAYRKHLHSAAADIVKLDTLDASAADAVSFLLVGFDNTRLSIADADVDVIRANVNGRWAEQYREWPDPHRPDGHVKTWIWTAKLPRAGWKEAITAEIERNGPLDQD